MMGIQEQGFLNHVPTLVAQLVKDRLAFNV